MSSDFSELAGLAKQLPANLFDELRDPDTSLEEESAWTALHLPISSALAAAAFLQIFNLEGYVLTNANFGAIAFPKLKNSKKVIKNVKQITKEIEDFEIQLFRYEYNYLLAELYSAGKVVEKTPPPIVFTAMSETAELAILSKTDFYSKEEREVEIEEVKSLFEVKKRINNPDDIFIFKSSLISIEDAQEIIQSFIINNR